MRREEGDDVQGDEMAGEGLGWRGDGEQSRRTLNEDPSLRSGPEIFSWKVRVGQQSSQTLKTGGDGFGLRSLDLADAVVSLPPN